MKLDILMNTMECCYEELLLSSHPYRMREVLQIDVIESEDYIRISLKELQHLFKVWESNLCEKDSNRIYHVLNELYLFDSIEKIFMTYYDALFQRLKRYLKSEYQLKWTRTLEQEASYWLKHLFVEKKKERDDWFLLRFCLCSQLKEYEFFEISQSDTYQLFCWLDTQLDCYLRLPLRTKFQVYSQLQRPLRLITLNEASTSELVEGVMFALNSSKEPMEETTEIEVALNTLIVNLEIIPQKNDYPSWDYETILDLMLESLMRWIESCYALSEEEVLGDKMQSLVWRLWRKYWASKSATVGVDWLKNQLIERNSKKESI